MPSQISFTLFYIGFSYFLVCDEYLKLNQTKMIKILVVLALTIGTATFVACVNQARDSKPQYVPKKLHSWKWLPVWCRSLEPYDRYMCGYGLQFK